MKISGLANVEKAIKTRLFFDIFTYQRAIYVLEKKSAPISRHPATGWEQMEQAAKQLAQLRPAYTWRILPPVPTCTTVTRSSVMTGVARKEFLREFSAFRIC